MGTNPRLRGLDRASTLKLAYQIRQSRMSYKERQACANEFQRQFPLLMPEGTIEEQRDSLRADIEAIGGWLRFDGVNLADLRGMAHWKGLVSTLQTLQAFCAQILMEPELPMYHYVDDDDFRCRCGH